MAKAKIENQSYAYSVAKMFNKIRLRATPSGAWFEGGVVTEQGYVMVYSETGYTTLEIIYRGRSYQRRISEGYSARSLVTLARRYAKEIAG